MLQDLVHYWRGLMRTLYQFMVLRKTYCLDASIMKRYSNKVFKFKNLKSYRDSTENIKYKQRGMYVAYLEG